MTRPYRKYEWDEAFEYLGKAWKEVVLPRLVRRFAEGPVDWTPDGR